VCNSAKVAEDNEITPQSNYVNVWHDGSCFWQPRYEKSVTQCPVDVTWFPFDEQVCDLDFESWVMDRFSMNLITDERALDLDDFLQPDGWRLTGMVLQVTDLSIKNAGPVKVVDKGI